MRQRHNATLLAFLLAPRFPHPPHQSPLFSSYYIAVYYSYQKGRPNLPSFFDKSTSKSWSNPNMMSSSEATGETSASLQNIPATYARLKRQYQQSLDRITPHVLYRWVGTAVTIAIFELRIVYAQGVRVPLNILEFHRS